MSPLPPPKDRDVPSVVADLVSARAALATFHADETKDAATSTRLWRLHYQIAALESEYRKAAGLGPDSLVCI